MAVLVCRLLTDVSFAYTDFVQDAYASPQASALNFVTTLVEVRPQHTLKPILGFIQDISSK